MDISLNKFYIFVHIFYLKFFLFLEFVAVHPVQMLSVFGPWSHIIIIFPATLPQHYRFQRYPQRGTEHKGKGKNRTKIFKESDRDRDSNLKTIGNINHKDRDRNRDLKTLGNINHKDRDRERDLKTLGNINHKDRDRERDLKTLGNIIYKEGTGIVT